MVEWLGGLFVKWGRACSPSLCMVGRCRCRWCREDPEPGTHFYWDGADGAVHWTPEFSGTRRAAACGAPMAPGLPPPRAADGLRLTCAACKARMHRRYPALYPRARSVP